MREREMARLIERVRGYRAGGRGLGGAIGGDGGVLGREMGRLARAVKSHDRGMAAWDEVVPAPVRAGVVVVSSVKGVVKVRVVGAVGARRFALDRWLRGGGEEELRGRGVRVRVVG